MNDTVFVYAKYSNPLPDVHNVYFEHKGDALYNCYEEFIYSNPNDTIKLYFRGRRLSK